MPAIGNDAAGTWRIVSCSVQLFIHIMYSTSQVLPEYYDRKLLTKRSLPWHMFILGQATQSSASPVRLRLARVSPATLFHHRWPRSSHTRTAPQCQHYASSSQRWVESVSSGDQVFHCPYKERLQIKCTNGILARSYESFDRTCCTFLVTQCIWDMPLHFNGRYLCLSGWVFRAHG